ncbi:unnamed protein product [Amoebophrya sp. A120]|nr:unnamed protein product [Amoebophrya sp. A120]|eukprot:GSA120T00020194001.1
MLMDACHFRRSQFVDLAELHRPDLFRSCILAKDTHTFFLSRTKHKMALQGMRVTTAASVPGSRALPTRASRSRWLTTIPSEPNLPYVRTRDGQSQRQHEMKSIRERLPLCRFLDRRCLHASTALQDDKEEEPRSILVTSPAETRLSGTLEEGSSARRESPVEIAEAGARIFLSAVKGLDSAWHFYPLPYQWPATFLVQYQEAELHSECDSWFPLSLKTTFQTYDRNKKKLAKVDPRSMEMPSDKRVFVYNRVNELPHLQIFVGPLPGMFFVDSPARGVRRRKATTDNTKTYWFNESEQVGARELVRRLQNEWQGGSVRGKGEWYRSFLERMGTLSGKTATFCRAMIQMQDKVYGPLGAEVTYRRAQTAHNTVVNGRKVLHRVASPVSHYAGRALTLTTGTTTTDSGVRPYSLAELQALDFVCGVNYCREANEVRGFFFFPRSYLVTRFAPSPSKNDHCKPTYWVYFPEDSHRARSDEVKKRIPSDLEFYIDLEERDGNQLQKLRRILEGT